MEKKIVAIGGGTGVSTILKGLKDMTTKISAIVSMSDDGGGSGILRDELQILPPGDVRRCLLALSNTDEILKKLIEYRFKTGTLKGQNVGNILIAALADISGSFEEGLMEMSSVFNITGRVLPVTFDETHLVAELETKDKIVGESYIPKMSYRLRSKIEKMSMIPDYPKANEDAIAAIKEADIVIIGPGSLYTSIIPNFLVAGINEALKNTSGRIVFIANAMTQLGETLNYSLMDHVEAINKHTGDNIIDVILANNKRAPEEVYDYYYGKNESEPIFVKEEERKYFKNNNIKLIEGDFIDLKDGLIRHDGHKIGKVILGL